VPVPGPAFHPTGAWRLGISVVGGHVAATYRGRPPTWSRTAALPGLETQVLVAPFGGMDAGLHISTPLV